MTNGYLVGPRRSGRALVQLLTQVISWGETMEFLIFQLKMFEKSYMQ